MIKDNFVNWNEISLPNEVLNDRVFIKCLKQSWNQVKKNNHPYWKKDFNIWHAHYSTEKEFEQPFELAIKKGLAYYTPVEAIGSYKMTPSDISWLSYDDAVKYINRVNENLKRDNIERIEFANLPENHLGRYMLLHHCELNVYTILRATIFFFGNDWDWDIVQLNGHWVVCNNPDLLRKFIKKGNITKDELPSNLYFSDPVLPNFDFMKPYLTYPDPKVPHSP